MFVGETFEPHDAPSAKFFVSVIKKLKYFFKVLIYVSKKLYTFWAQTGDSIKSCGAMVLER
jgi:hypothetical protein